MKATARAAETWAYVLNPEGGLPVNDLRPAFATHRLICAIAEMEELCAVHRALWPLDQEQRLRLGEPIVDKLIPRQDLIKKASVVAVEEGPDPELARSKNVDDLFEFFCQVRKAILFSGDATDTPFARNVFGSIEVAMGSLQGLDRRSRVTLDYAISEYVRNSFIYSTTRLPSGSVLGKRYWPLFHSLQLLREGANMEMDEIGDILDEAKIKPETRNQVRILIENLRRVLSEYDIDGIKDILASEGRLFPGTGQDESIAVIPGDGSGQCAPIVLAIAKGKRGRYRLPNVMQEVRAYLIQCFEIAEVVVLLTDRWDPDLMKESEADFFAYATRATRRKVLIPIVCWKRQLSTYKWP